jgi:hypothetical protein
VRLYDVAPHAGAWIETGSAGWKVRLYESPLTQGRGLKHPPLSDRGVKCESPLTQGRGLKRFLSEYIQRVGWVAPHAGAWIETGSAGWKVRLYESPLTQGRGLKLWRLFVNVRVLRRPSRRGVD